MATHTGRPARESLGPPEPSRADVGDKSANLEALLAAQYETIWGLCYRLTRNADVADDLAQEACLRVVRYRASFRGASDFRTWLFRLTRNVCLDHFKAARREIDLATALAVEPEVPPSPSGPDLPDGAAERLKEALTLLSITDREVLVLTRYYDLRSMELAQVLETTPGAARVRMHRALVALRDRYLELERRDNALRNGHRAAR